MRREEYGCPYCGDYAPSADFWVVAPQHMDSLLNSAFVSEYGDLIAGSRIDARIYEHLYTSIDCD